MRDSLPRLLLAFALLGLLALAVTPVTDFDLFWQMQSGKYLWQTGSFVRTDLFSLASTVPRFEHCWLHDLIFFATWSAGGFVGVSLLKGGIVLALGVALCAAARARGGSWPALLAATIPLVALSNFAWLERPQLWTFLALALLLWWYERHRQSSGRALWGLVGIVAVWSNLHAGALTVLPVLLALVVGEWGDAALERAGALTPELLRRLFRVAAAAAGALLLTPYAPQMVAALFGDNLYGSNATALMNAGNMDWRPMTFAANPWFFYLAGASLLLMAAGWKLLKLRDFFLLAGFFFMGTRLERHTVFLYLAAAAILPLYLDEAVRQLAAPLSAALRRAGYWFLLLLAGGLAFGAIATVKNAKGWLEPGLREWHFPIAAAEFVRREKLPPNLYNTYDWGGYLMWALYPDYKVFWDGRQDSTEMFAAGYAVARGDREWRGILSRFGVKTLVLKPCTVDTGQHYPILDHLGKDDDWRLVFADASSLVFVRSDAVPAEWLSRYELPKSRIDDAILSEATLLTAADRFRYMGWWEIARVHLARNDYRAAFPALQNHFSAGGNLPEARQWYSVLAPMMKQ